MQKSKLKSGIHLLAVIGVFFWLGLLYFSTANPAPAFNGALREGDNLYSVSMIALDVGR